MASNTHVRWHNLRSKCRSDYLETLERLDTKYWNLQTKLHQQKTLVAASIESAYAKQLDIIRTMERFDISCNLNTQVYQHISMTNETTYNLNNAQNQNNNNNNSNDRMRISNYTNNAYDKNVNINTVVSRPATTTVLSRNQVRNGENIKSSEKSTGMRNVIDFEISNENGNTIDNINTNDKETIHNNGEVEDDSMKSENLFNLTEKYIKKLNIFNCKGESKYECRECHMTLSSKYNAKLHVGRMHFEDKPFDCHYCDQSFSLPVLRKYHIQQRHHDNQTSTRNSIKINNKQKNEGIVTVGREKTNISNNNNGRGGEWQEPEFSGNFAQVVDVANTQGVVEQQLKTETGKEKREGVFREKAKEKEKETDFEMEKRMNDYLEKRIKADCREVTNNDGQHGWQCNICNDGKIFVGKGNLKKHIASKHTNDNRVDRPFRCKVCDKGFAMKCILDSHCTYSHMERKTNSTLRCGSRSGFNGNNYGSSNGNGDRNDNQDMSNDCVSNGGNSGITTGGISGINNSGGIGRRQPLRRSSRRRKSTSSGIYECKHCSRTFSSKIGLMTHEKSHNGNEKPYFCPICYTRFKEIRYRDTHIRNYHPSYKNINTNEFRNQNINTNVLKTRKRKEKVKNKNEEDKSDNWYNRNTDDKNDNGNDNCDSIFSQNTRNVIESSDVDETTRNKLEQLKAYFNKNLQKVEDDENDTINWQCLVCNLLFNAMGNGLKHVARVHTTLDQRPLECDKCGQRFAMWGLYTTHCRHCNKIERVQTNTKAKINSGDGTVTINSSNIDNGANSRQGHKCQHCDKVFEKSTSLRGHMQVHRHILMK